MGRVKDRIHLPSMSIWPQQWNLGVVVRLVGAKALGQIIWAIYWKHIFHSSILANSDLEIYFQIAIQGILIQNSVPVTLLNALRSGLPSLE